MYNYNYPEDYLMHYGVKGMKWGHRKAQKYEAKAKMYRNWAKDYDPKDYTVKLSDKERSKMLVEQSKLNAKADKMEVKARLAREGKDDIKKLKAANKLKGHYVDTQGMVRGPYADAIGDIRTKKGERYASALMKKFETQQVLKLSGEMTAAGVVYAAGMAALINKM